MAVESAFVTHGSCNLVISEEPGQSPQAHTHGMRVYEERGGCSRNEDQASSC